MSEVNPTPATEDPPPLVNGESAASDKNNNAENFGPEERREVAVTSSNADEVKNGCENGTEGTTDEVAHFVEADDSSDSGCANVMGAEDVKMDDTQREANIEGADVKMVDTQHEANTETEDVKIVDTQFEAEDVKMVDTQHEANIEAEDVKMVGTQDVKMVHRQHEANIGAEEDACQDKEGKNGDNQHDKATEGEDMKIEAKATARNSEAQDAMEDACQKEDKLGKNEDRQDAKVAEADEMKIIEAAADVRNAEVQENVKEEMEDKVEEKKKNTNIEDADVKSVDKEAGCQKEDEGNNEDGHDAEVAEGDEIRMEEMEDKVREKENNGNIEDDVENFGKEVACQKEDEDNHDAKVAEGDEVKMVVAKTDAGNAEVEGKGKEEKAEKIEQENNNANVETKLIVLEKDDACLKEDKKVNNDDIQDAKEADGEHMKVVEEKTDAVIAEAIANRKKGEMEGNTEEIKKDTRFDAENVIMVDQESACQNKDKEGKTGDSQDGKAAEGEDMKIVEAKSDAGNAGAKENGKKEETEQHNEEKAKDVNNQADEVKIIDNEDSCQKEDKGRKNEDSHHAKAAVVEAKSADVHAEVKENRKKEYQSMTEDEQNGDKEEIVCVKRQDEDIMEPMEVDKQEKQDGLNEEEKCGVDKQEVGDREESVKESQEVLKGEAKDNVDKQEMDDREENVKEKQEGLFQKKQEGLEEEERVGSSKHVVAKVEDIKIVEAKSDAGNAAVKENGKKEEKEQQNEEKANDINNQADEVKIADKEDACQKEDKERKNEDSHRTMAAVVEAKSADVHAEVKENRKKEYQSMTEDEQNDDKEEIMCVKRQDEDRMEPMEVDKQEKQDGLNEEEKCGVDKQEVGDREESVKESQEVLKGEAKDNVDKQEMDDSEENVKGKQEELEEEGRVGSSKHEVAKVEDIKIVESKSDAGNVGVKENGKKEEKDQQNEEKANDINNQADEVQIVDKEDACQKEDKGRKNEDSHHAKAEECVEIMLVEAKSTDVHTEVKENGKKEQDQSTSEEEQNDGNICVKRQDEDRMEPMEVDTQEKKDGSNEEEKGGVDKQEVSDQEESVKESQEVLKGEAKDNVDKQEMDDREENVKEKQEGLEEEERVGSSKHEVAKDEQDRAAEKQVGEKQDGNVAAEKKEEEKQDAKLTAEEKDKTQERKVAAEKKEEVNKNVTFENNAETVIEMGVSEKDEEMETNGKTTADKQGGKKDSRIDGISKEGRQKKGTKRSNADIDDALNGSASKKEKGDEAVEEVGESDKNMEENKDEAPKRKKARIAREEDHKKDKKQSSSKSMAAKDFLNTPSPYSLDRPARTRKTVERLVEVIEKEPSGSLFIEKGRGTPLKNIPGVAYRIARKNQGDLKFLHQLLFGRFGKAADFKSHILEFSGFVWHESDEKHRAKAKEKLDKCSKETLFDLCRLLVIPVSRVNSKKEDIIMKLLDFIAEPHANDDSTISDGQAPNSRKRRREEGSAAKNSEGKHKRSRKDVDDEHISCKRQQKYSEFEFYEGHKDDEHIKSDREEAKDDSEEADDEQEDSHDSIKVKASQKSMEGNGSTAQRKAIIGSDPKRAHVATLSNCSSRVSSSSKTSKDKQRSVEDSNLRMIKPITTKHTVKSQKATIESRSSGKGLTTSKGQLAEAEKAFPSKRELQNTIVGFLKKIDFNTVTYSDVLRMLSEHYKMDLSSRKEDIKLMVYGELIKISEAGED